MKNARIARSYIDGIRDINMYTAFVCARTGLSGFERESDYRISTGRGCAETGARIFHGTRLCGDGISHSSWDRGVRDFAFHGTMR